MSICLLAVAPWDERRGRKKVRLDLLLSCLVGGVIGLGIPRRVIRRIKRKCGIKAAPRRDETETAAKQEKRT